MTDRLTFDVSLADMRTWLRRVVVLAVVAAAIIVVAWSIGRELHGPTTFDADVSNWFLRHRTSRLDGVTSIFGQGASSITVVGLCLVAIFAA
jgi:hypothetical protein